MLPALLTELVRAAPELPAATVEAALAELAAWPGDRALAGAIARVLELVAHGRVDAGAALPHLAMACETLCDPRLGDRERAAARYEIETFLPVPTARRGERAGEGVGEGEASEREPRGTTIDVTADRLIRGPRPRT